MNTDEVDLFLVDIKSYICLKDDNISLLEKINSSKLTLDPLT